MERVEHVVGRRESDGYQEFRFFTQNFTGASFTGSVNKDIVSRQYRKE